MHDAANYPNLPVQWNVGIYPVGDLCVHNDPARAWSHVTYNTKSSMFSKLLSLLTQDTGVPNLTIPPTGVFEHKAIQWNLQ